MISNYTNLDLQFLDRGGEMGRLTREKDWSKNPLGTPDTWSQSLRTSLSILLNSKFPMFLFWGPDLICFYNDAYRPSLGNDGKHPDILGGRGEDHWKEIWKDIKPLIDQVIEKGEATWHEDLMLPIYRNGKMEDVYWTFSYSPVNDESGKPAGVFVVCSETTENVSTLKKLKETELRFRTMADNIPNLAWMAHKDGWIYWYNKKWYDYTGTTPAEMEGWGWQSVHDSTYLPLVLNKWNDSIKYGEPFEMVFPLKGADGSFRQFLTRVLPVKNEYGEIIQWYGSNTDITTQKQIEESLRESEHRFKNTVQQAAVAIAIFRGEDYIVEMANDAFLKMVSKTEKEFLGKPLYDIFPETKEAGKHINDSILLTGIPFQGNEFTTPISRNGKLEICYFDIISNPLREDDGTITGIIVTANDVTEKVNARKKIEQSEEKLNIVIKASELGTWELNVKTKEAKYSDRYLEILGGYTEPVQLTHKQLLAHLHPDDMGIRDKAFKDAIANGHLSYEARLIWKDKSIHWMQGKGKVFYDVNGQAEKMIGTIQDITKERTQQLQLIENERKFRLLSDSMPQHIWTSDVEGNLNYFNKSVIEYSGLSLKEINEKGWLDIVHPDDRDENVKRWINSITTGKDFLIEHRFRRHDGKYRWQLSRAIPQKDENGKILMWVGTSTDIHDQKNFATELEKQVKERTKELHLLNESLRLSQERYHLMVGEVQDYAILYISLDGIIENWNKGAEKIKGYKTEEIIGKSFENFYTSEDIENNLPQNLLKQALKNGRTTNEGWRVRKDGGVFWANVVITAVHNSEGMVIGFSKVTHDLTRKKQSDDQLRMNAVELKQKNEELEKMNKELQSFAYISSHDLQEPLRKIQTFSNLIIDKEFDNLSETGKDKFKRIQNAAQRMQTLINDLLAYSRTNTQEVKLTKTNLNLLIDEVKEDLKEEIEQMNATVEVEKIETNIDIVPFQIHQLLFNLISNSLKFSLNDIAPVIKIKSEIKKGKNLNNDKLRSDIEYCHITFSDNGIGFDQQYSEKIFEVFQRLHGKETYQGTGIGLAIVKKIIDNHKGVITATSETNKGATFDIYIPVKA